MSEPTFLVSKNDLLAAIAKNAVHQSPYHRPDNLEAVLDEANRVLSSHFELADKENLGYLDATYEEIKSLVGSLSYAIGDMEDWNHPKSGNHSPAIFTSLDGGLHPDDDFIALGALARNVANDILRSQCDEEVPIPDILNREVKGG